MVLRKILWLGVIFMVTTVILFDFAIATILLSLVT